jgi:WD40 repeat protein
MRAYGSFTNKISKNTHNIIQLLFFLIFILLLQSVASGVATPPYVSPSNPITPQPIWSDQTGGSDAAFGLLASISGDGRYIASGSDTGKIQFYNNRGDLLWTTMAPSGIRELQISRNGEYLTATTIDNILFFNRSGILLWNYSSPGNYSQVAVSGDGNVVVIGDGDTIRFFNARGVQSASARISERVGNIAIASDGLTSIVGTGYRENKVYVIGTNGSVLGHFETEDTIPFQNILNVRISDNESSLVVSDTHNIYSIRPDGEKKWRYENTASLGYGKDLALSGDGTSIATCDTTSSVIILNKTGLKTGSFRAAPPHDVDISHRTLIEDISVSGNGEYIVVGNSDNDLFVLDRHGTHLWSYHASTPVSSVALSNNGKYIVAGTHDAVYFFNRDGTPTVPEPVITETFPVPESAPVTTGTPTASSPVLIVMVALGVVGIIYSCYGKVR